MPFHASMCAACHMPRLRCLDSSAATRRPAVILSYAVAGISALLSSLCYSEFAVRMPLVGGAYTYVNAVFGEYFAW
jgi:amino acid transporter